ncbi:TPA_asm: phage repressor protein CI, partial [Salmonella enterica subsp. enterica serovar Infantis]|nr:phage repressor protein CI [Salmonella enterica subsp. enterica serovar Infantis]
IPIKKVRVSGVGMAFDCSIEDIKILGRVVLTIK